VQRISHECDILRTHLYVYGKASAHNFWQFLKGLSHEIFGPFFACMDPFRPVCELLLIFNINNVPSILDKYLKF
jgi:hypothetical protein